MLTNFQWAAVVILMLAIALSQLSGGETLEGDHKIVVAVILAILGSMLSVAGTVIMEYLFKNDRREFTDKQMQLYLYGSAMSWVLYILEVTFSPVRAPPTPVQSSGISGLIIFLLVTNIGLCLSSGIMVAAIVKRLDNMVKLYSQAVGNMLTSLACSVFFPAHFHINSMFGACLLLMFLAICMYENKNIGASELSSIFRQASGRRTIITAIGTTIIVMSLCIIFARTDFSRTDFSRLYQTQTQSL